MTGLTTTVEALVGAACIAMGWACWQRATPVFRTVAVMLGIAGVAAIANAVTALR